MMSRISPETKRVIMKSPLHLSRLHNWTVSIAPSGQLIQNANEKREIEQTKHQRRFCSEHTPPSPLLDLVMTDWKNVYIQTNIQTRKCIYLWIDHIHNHRHTATLTSTISPHKPSLSLCDWSTGWVFHIVCVRGCAKLLCVRLLKLGTRILAGNFVWLI